MADLFSKDVRSNIMRAVKSKGNISTEIKLINLLKKNKIKGWRRNYRLYGNPDFVFPKKRIVIFADGCFWHGHNCRKTFPKQNSEYWVKKIARNIKRDQEVSKILRKKYWQVFRIYECKILNSKIPATLIKACKG